MDIAGGAPHSLVSIYRTCTRVSRNNSEQDIGLHEAPLPLLKGDMAAAGISNPIFMPDHSPIHNSYLTGGWLERDGWEVGSRSSNLLSGSGPYLNMAGILIFHEKFPDCPDGPATTVEKRLAECCTYSINLFTDLWQLQISPHCICRALACINGDA